MIDVPKIEGEVQRWELTQHWRGYDSWETMEKDQDGEWIRAEDYAALNEYSALVEMQLRAEVERLRALLKSARPYVQAYAAITRTDEVSLACSETAEAMREELSRAVTSPGTAP